MVELAKIVVRRQSTTKKTLVEMTTGKVNDNCKMKNDAKNFPTVRQLIIEPRS